MIRASRFMTDWRNVGVGIYPGQAAGDVYCISFIEWEILHLADVYGGRKPAVLRANQALSLGSRHGNSFSKASRFQMHTVRIAGLSTFT